MTFYGPWNGIQGHLVFALSVTKKKGNPKPNFNLRQNFWNMRYRDFLFGMHTLINETLSHVIRVDDLMTVTMTFFLRIYILDFVAAGGLIV